MFEWKLRPFWNYKKSSSKKTSKSDLDLHVVHRQKCQVSACYKFIIYITNTVQYNDDGEEALFCTMMMAKSVLQNSTDFAKGIRIKIS